MKLKVRARSLFPLALMVVMAGVVIDAATFGDYRASLIPMVFGGLIFVLAAVQFWKEVSAKPVVHAAPKGEGASSAPETEGALPGTADEKSAAQGRAFGTALAWFLGFTAAIYILGFVVAMPLYTITYLKARRRGWIAAIVMAVVTTLSIYVTFDYLFGTPLWKGVYFEWW